MRALVRRLVLAMLLFFAGFAVLNWEVSYGQTADEILGRSKVAMSPPIKFTLDVNGEIMYVYEKMLSSNLYAKKTVPRRKGVYFLSLDKDVFEIHELSRVVIDKGLMEENLKVASLNSLGEGEMSGLRPQYRIVEESFAGLSCWKLSQSLDTKLVTKAASVLTRHKVDNVPREIETFIAKDSYKKVGSVIRYENGTESVTKILDVEPLHDVQDDFFLPPVGFAKVIPKSLSEYTQLAHGLAAINQLSIATTERPLSSRVLKNLGTRSTGFPAAANGPGVVSDRAKQVWFWIWAVVISTLIVRGIYMFCRLRRRMNIFGKSLKKDG
jgi:hypothetical protein